ncbi:MAG: 3-hydroxyisobutyrate dehydrogenase [Labilithrix sp.]|nr:3-hydroxyisobutyrate dehydrogenase [Labilithrix sp.]
MDVGFIGTGSMGAAMVPNLVAAGHRVSVWNRSRASAEALAGVTVLDGPEQAFANDVVITMLADDKAVRSVVLDSGALQAAKPGCVHVMAATISVTLVEELAQRHREAGVAYVSAPVFGVPAAAAAAKLNIVAAGDPAAIDKVQPLFDVLGQKTWRLGDDPTRANIVKIAGNMMITLALEAMGEAAGLTERYGVPGKELLDVLTSTLFASPSYQRYGGFIGSRTYEPGFTLTLGMKDVDLALAAAREKGAKLPAAEVVKSSMMTAIEQGLGQKDWSVLAEVARTRS